MRDTAPTPAAHAAPSELWTIQQAAAYLNVHRRFLERRMYDGRLTTYKINGFHVRLDAAEVRALVTVVPVTPAGGAR